MRGYRWPSPATCLDFGIRSDAHLGALQYAVVADGVTAEQLDEAMGRGDKLQTLISPRNPYRYVTFRTDWDELHREMGEEPEGMTE